MKFENNVFNRGFVQLFLSSSFYIFIFIKEVLIPNELSEDFLWKYAFKVQTDASS